MDTFHQFGTALGLAGLSGINLYLTVLVIGLAIQYHWITLAPEYSQFEIFAHPLILGIIGVLFLVQFFADKIPWLDNLWDVLQTFIRPLGGACLAVLAMGHSHPNFQVAIALMGGAVALTTHLAKSGTRLAVNTSPEPFSNIFLSLAEDIVIIGILVLIYLKPIIGLVVSLIFLITLFILLPNIIARARIVLWLIKNKLNAPAWNFSEITLPSWIPATVHAKIARLCPGSSEIAWALPCATASSSTFPRYMQGWLVALTSSPSPIYFLGKKGWRWRSLLIPVERLFLRVEPRFLSDRLVFSSQEPENFRHVFVFPRSLSHEVRLAEEDIHRRIPSLPPPRENSI